MTTTAAHHGRRQVVRGDEDDLALLGGLGQMDGADETVVPCDELGEPLVDFGAGVLEDGVVQSYGVQGGCSSCRGADVSCRALVQVMRWCR
ncbi:hypothetical protein [Streptomyces tailanensis]|uniref:hypothetical protein n=1 Tax=Streptomyces tailanensis TaxID=2569858 RepID=UPI00122DEF19|nr:hypothetical protein [Streptomyces tailanensis]